MKKKAIRKELFRTVKRTWNRYLAIIMIVGLGVAFFSGLRATKPDMQLSADTFYDDSNFYDIQVLGSLGMTDEDIEKISEIEGVETVEPAYSEDVLCDTTQQRLVVKMMSLPKTVNQLEISEGRLPEKSGECFADTRFMESTGMKLGDEITVESGTENELADSLKRNTYTIVGAGSSPQYLSIQRGSSAIGSGSVNSFLAILPEDFTLEAYTSLFVTTRGTDDKNTYEQAYQDQVDQITARIEGIADAQCTLRYEDVKQEADEKIADGEKEITDGEKEVADAEEKLADARQKLADAKQKITDGEEEVEEKAKELADGKKELEEAEQKIADAKPQLEDALKKLQDGQKEIDTKQQELYEGYDAYKNGVATYEDGKKELEYAKEELEKQKQQFEQLKLFLSPQMVEAYEKQFADAQKQIDDNALKLEEGREELDSSWYQLESGQLKLTDARKELESGWKEYQEKLTEFEDGKKEVEENRIKLEDGEKKIAQARIDLADAQKEYEDANETFIKEEAEAKKELEPAKEDLQEAGEKLADAKREMADLEMPEWYVLDRNSNQTFVEYGQDADRIGAIGKFFPAIFFLVAALVALTTMTRMVEEERTQIGTLKALGYANLSIAGKYIFYALSASLLGSLIGLVVGQKVLPYVIITAYKILYQNLPQVLTPLSGIYSVSSTLTAILCTGLAAFFACCKELQEQPSVLMRPQTPKSGKRVFLEYLPFIWKRMNFTAKSTVRNLFRYKKRFFMTVFGIGGCMALLIVGFGLKDAIYVVGNEQFINIITYHGAITLEEDLEEEKRENITADLSENPKITDSLSVYQHLLDAEANAVTKEAYVIVPSEEKKLDEYVRLQERLSKKKISLGKNGVVISEKLATMLKLKVGERITLKEDDFSPREVVVADITENYYMNYIYMSNACYEQVYGSKAEYNTIFFHEADTSKTAEEENGRELLKLDGISQVTFYSSLSSRITDMLKSMDSIIVVLVLSAGALAFIVLYNLNNINVTERKRELSTLKVLGFYDMEVSSYVFRENIVLTLFGCILGLFLGTVLTRFVVVTAEVDVMMFGRQIKAVSYGYSLLLTFLFSLIVNGVMHFSLKKVDMLEALKSIE